MRSIFLYGGFRRKSLARSVLELEAYVEAFGNVRGFTVRTLAVKKPRLSRRPEVT